MMNKKVFSTLFLAVFSVTLGVGLVVPLLPVYAYELGATGLYIGFIFGAFSLSRTAFLPYFGHLSDLKGRKPFITAGLLAYFLVSIAYVLSKDVNFFIAIRFFQGIASAMILPVAQAYVGEITPKHKEGFVMGLFNVSLYGGLSIGPLVGGMVKDTFGIQSSFLSMGLVSLVGFLLCLIFLPPRGQEKLHTLAKPPLRYRILIRNKYIGALFMFRLAYTACIGIVWAFLPLFAHARFKLSSSAIGVLVMLGVLTSGLLQTPMGVLADRFNKRALIAIGGLVSAGAVFSFVHVQGFWGLFVGNILFGVGGGIAVPAVMAMTVIIGRRTDSMGSVMALLTMGHSLGMLTGPILAGIMMDAFQLGLAFMGGTVVMVTGVAVVLVLTSGFQAWAEE
ncbi:MAG: MFS transporter [Deltaproteobacteria bacterium]|nr:MFS transporter [Deltaproteobacteria bacterium]MBW2018720.1 MFS transporter [Deltaproteobacteria bacterium]MBW2073449.1 MFS transporter [Deltaproteobacteria bacterium]RLB83059.1 MAG: MFS transporter [Deltaproteobacteria bacterium]